MRKRWALKRLKRLNSKIKKNWDKLTDNEIALYQENPAAFYEAVKKKYSIFKDDAERRIKEFKGGRNIFNW